jgi:ribonuclease HII
MVKKIICGIDEVGRGPLAGPVVSAAVVLPFGHNIQGLADSKILSPKKRSELFEEIIAIADIGVGIVSRKDIDRINILQATYISMKKAYDKLQIKPDSVLVDGFRIPSKRIKSEGVIKGDEKIQEISAASIVAKVTRDKLMKLVDPVFPKFEFYKNKGYGTKVHMNALVKYKATLIHRRSFSPVKNNLPSDLLRNSTFYKQLIIEQKKSLVTINKEIKNWLILKNVIC